MVMAVHRCLRTTERIVGDPDGPTSMPELLTALNAIKLGVPSLSAGDLLGSSMFNMLILAILDLLYQQRRVLHQVGTMHALNAGLVVLLTGLAVFFIPAKIKLQIAWVGLV